jgi:hypothetical protein
MRPLVRLGAGVHQHFRNFALQSMFLNSPLLSALVLGSVDIAAIALEIYLSMKRLVQ